LDSDGLRLFIRDGIWAAAELGQARQERNPGRMAAIVRKWLGPLILERQIGAGVGH
jgi:hypothetical protein